MIDFRVYFQSLAYILCNIQIYCSVRQFRLNPEECLVQMYHPAGIYVKGKIKLTVLYGCVQMLGYTVTDRHTTPVSVYSPRSQSRIQIITSPNGGVSNITETELEDRLKHLYFRTAHVQKSSDVSEMLSTIKKQKCSICLIEKLVCDTCSFVSSVSTFQTLFLDFTNVCELFNPCNASTLPESGSDCVVNTKFFVNVSSEVSDLTSKGKLTRCILN